MGFGIWGVDHMPIHKRKEKKIIRAYVQQACLCTWLQELPLEKANLFITWWKKP
jgi:hypothetical protein